MRPARALAKTAAALAGGFVLAWSGAALAQDSQNQTVPVTGSVTLLCSLAPTTGGDDTFALGALIDLTDGRLSDTLEAAPKAIAGSWCNARSQITIEAQPLAATSFVDAPPDGFSRMVDFTATASGWTDQPAVYSTATGAGAASQSRDLPNTSDIVVAISDFSTRGGDLRLVADAAYEGAVVITLAVEP